VAHLVLVDNPAFHPQGDFALEAEKMALQGEKRLTYAGMGIFHPRLFADAKPGAYGIKPILQQALAKNQLITGEHYRGMWDNVNTPQQLQQLNESL
jgi:MurNAc alpha-1-phosphate uridylyltransferase